MVVRTNTRKQLLSKVAEIYEWIDLQIQESANLAGRCSACGKCCDFEGFDHKLFVTPPELIYLAANLGAENISILRSRATAKDEKPMSNSRCPYNIDGKCGIYEYRFAGCRIFFCNADKYFQSTLSESALKKFKSLCAQLSIPYRYSDLATALNNLAEI